MFCFRMFDLDKYNKSESDESDKEFLLSFLVCQVPVEVRWISAEECNDSLTVFPSGGQFPFSRSLPSSGTLLRGW